MILGDFGCIGKQRKQGLEEEKGPGNLCVYIYIYIHYYWIFGFGFLDFSCKFSRWREGVVRRIFGPILDLSLKSKVELWIF